MEVFGTILSFLSIIIALNISSNQENTNKLIMIYSGYRDLRDLVMHEYGEAMEAAHDAMERNADNITFGIVNDKFEEEYRIANTILNNVSATLSSDDKYKKLRLIRDWQLIVEDVNNKALELTFVRDKFMEL